MRDAKRSADAASAAIAEFVAVMSHEIRTPLFGLMARLELLGTTSLNQAQQQLRTLENTATFLLRTINQTLDLCRLEAGEDVLKTQSFSPRHLVEAVVASYSDLALSKGLRLYSLVDAEVPDAVLGDELRLRQILNNVMNNAIKFTESGQAVLRLTAVADADEQVRLQFQLADTGRGMLPALRDRLFVRYSRDDGDDSSGAMAAYSGSGLGLFICKRLAALMDAQLSVTSELGLGTSITLEISLVCQASALPPRPRWGRVFVSGQAQEMVVNLCSWLQRWGLRASPYHPDVGIDPDAAGAVLLQAWPPAARTPVWSGRQVVMRPLGQWPSQPASSWLRYCSAYDLDGVRQALERPWSLPAPSLPAELPQVPARVLVVDDNPLNRQVLRE